MFLGDAWRGVSNAVNYLMKFVAIVISTGDQGDLQTLSDLALKHIIDSTKHCNVCKDEMEHNISETLLRRQQLENNIETKDVILTNKTNLLKSKEKKVFTWECKVRNAQAVYERKEQTYLALQEKYERAKSAMVGVNMATAGYGLFLTVITGGAAASIAFGFQSGFTLGSICALHKAMTNLDTAKHEYKKLNYKLKTFHKEKMELQNDCEKLQNECDQCRKDKQNIQDEHEHLLGSLDNTTTLLSCLLNCRHFISILQGRTEVLQEARKDIAFQHDLRLPLNEIIKHLTSVSRLNLHNLSEIQQLCENLSGQLKLMTNSFSNFNIFDE